MSTLRFADLDGDGKTDVIDVSEERLRFSSGGRSNWVTLRYQRDGDFKLGDFDGDGSADLLPGECL